jgi:hypothetical protein
MDKLIISPFPASVFSSSTEALSSQVTGTSVSPIINTIDATSSVTIVVSVGAEVDSEAFELVSIVSLIVMSGLAVGSVVTAEEEVHPETAIKDMLAIRTVAFLSPM